MAQSSYQQIDVRGELMRKAIHMSSLWMCAFIYYADRAVALVVFGVLFAGMVAIEYLRKESPAFSKLFHGVFNNILRHQELSHKWTGASLLLLAALFNVALFSRSIAIAAMAIVVVSDTCAALVGRKVGRRKIMDKTAEGSVAFLLSSLAVVFATGLLMQEEQAFYLGGCAAAIVTTLLELFSSKLNIDDNLLVGASAGITIQLITTLHHAL